MKKRIISILASAALAVSMVPASALASDFTSSEPEMSYSAVSESKDVSDMPNDPKDKANDKAEDLSAENNNNESEKSINKTDNSGQNSVNEKADTVETTQSQSTVRLKTSAAENVTVTGFVKEGNDWVYKVSAHNQLRAIDVTLVDNKGNEIKMPTAMHDLSAYARLTKTSSSNALSGTLTAGAKTLYKAGQEAGMTSLASEWWHVQDQLNTSYSNVAGASSRKCDSNKNSNFGKLGSF